MFARHQLNLIKGIPMTLCRMGWDDNRDGGDDRVWIVRSVQKDNYGFAGTITANCPDLSGMR